MILVIGRPSLDERGELDGTAARVALAAVRADAPVELVGSVGDDADGDAAALALGQAGIGHAALLRDPAATTARAGRSAAEPAPRLDERDLELGLHYLVECRVLVLAEWLGEPVAAVAREAAAYHRARLVVVVPSDVDEPAGLPADATVLRQPATDSGAFAAVVGLYAAGLARGSTPAEAWSSALAASGWSEAGST